MSGFSTGAGPGGQTGICLFGIGIGHAADVLMLSRLSAGVKGCGEADRVWPAGMGRGSATVAMAVDDAHGDAGATPASASIGMPAQHGGSFRRASSYPAKQCVEECVGSCDGRERAIRNEATSPVSSGTEEM